MTTALEQLVSEFVDRDEELRLFREMRETNRKNILVVWGDSGLGKSSLLARMTHECARHGLAKAEVIWTETRPHDYKAVMRKIRDDVLSSLGGVASEPGSFALFSRFTDLINYFTQEHYQQLTIRVEGVPSINVAGQAAIQSGARVGDIAGIIVKDLMLNTARSDMAVPEAELMARLTDRFLADFEQALSRRPVAVFFDAAEKMSSDTEKWIWGELLTAARDGRLRNAIFVLCGQRPPPVDLVDRNWDGAVETKQLEPPAHGHIVDYLARRGVEAASREDLATMIEAAGMRTFLSIATTVDSFLRRQAQRQRSG
jgi:hypothetical protein